MPPCSDGTLSPAAAKVVLKELPEKSVYFITGGTDAWQVLGCWLSDCCMMRVVGTYWWLQGTEYAP